MHCGQHFVEYLVYHQGCLLGWYGREHKHKCAQARGCGGMLPQEIFLN